MDNNNFEENGFVYNYSAKEQAEVKRIREKYMSAPKAEDKMARLRKLDASVTRTAQIVALIFGIVGTIILGLGMSIIMTDLSEFMGLGNDMAMIVGIIIGIFGGVLVSIAYPIYNAIVKIKRKKIAPEIIRLTDELMK